ncbi:helix-turn-helix domain-containing protein [Megalodesulfovibrio paquesii]
MSTPASPSPSTCVASPDKEVAARLKGLRDALDWSAETMAAKSGASLEDVLQYESGTCEIPVSHLFKVAQAAGVDLTDLLSGHEAHLRRFTLVKKGQGAPVERRSAYNYLSLASRFTHRAMEPFLVTVPPCSRDDLHRNAHPGQEFCYLLEGRMEVLLEGEAVIMEPHDSLYFNAMIPHAMRGLDDAPATFLDVII